MTQNQTQRYTFLEIKSEYIDKLKIAGKNDELEYLRDLFLKISELNKAYTKEELETISLKSGVNVGEAFWFNKEKNLVSSGSMSYSLVIGIKDSFNGNKITIEELEDQLDIKTGVLSVVLNELREIGEIGGRNWGNVFEKYMGKYHLHLSEAFNFKEGTKIIRTYDDGSIDEIYDEEQV